MKKGLHLTLDDRCAIANGLNNRYSFKAIANTLGKDCTTISKEVKKHITISQSGCSGRVYNNCFLRSHCFEGERCEECTYLRMKYRCRSCNKCNFNCDKYQPEVCLRLSRPPYVCNGCPRKHNLCTLEKHLYLPKEAHKEYELSLRESRSGIGLSEAEVKQLDNLFSPLLKKRQSIHHIYVNHADSVMVSESTIYRLVDYQLFEARNIDLPRKVRYAPRKKKKIFKVDKTCRLNRTYTDYLNFCKENPDVPVTQIDSVEGKKGGKVLLTIHFVKAECMLAFLRDANDSQSVIHIFNRLYLELSPDVYCGLFPLLLGDNGSEFSNPAALELDGQGNQRSHVFYCDPSSPEQKGSCERNHEFLRMFIPKGTSLDAFTQSDISLMVDHINSYGRPGLGNKSPYEMMAFLYGEGLLKLLGCHQVCRDDVTLSPAIFKKGGKTDA